MSDGLTDETFHYKAMSPGGLLLASGLSGDPSALSSLSMPFTRFSGFQGASSEISFGFSFILTYF